jgi:hypothetical protein
MNHAQVSKILLTHDVVDCIVFWTKDPQNMMDKLDTLDKMGYKYYFQFSITPYDISIERGLREKAEIIKTFSDLSDRIGKDKVVWRYDPVILNNIFDISFHREQFTWLLSKLHKHTGQCIISFVDIYSKLKTNILRIISDDEMIELSKIISSAAENYGVKVKACCENSFLFNYGIEQASCIDKNLIEKICGQKLDVKKDKNQRSSCGCYESVDIGAYNTCKNGCVYCYANYSQDSVNNNCKNHNPDGELLIGQINDYDIIRVRNVKTCKSTQTELFE